MCEVQIGKIIITTMAMMMVMSTPTEKLTTTVVDKGYTGNLDKLKPVGNRGSMSMRSGYSPN